ncbi:hypothetical protein [Palleronia rufa]|uniref:hypothetical protein n=1 Tax=Palleronia rufa TaxID=1530186 RepID=UPI00068E1473
MIFAAFDEMQEIERNAVRLSKSAHRRKSRPEVDRPALAPAQWTVPDGNGPPSDADTAPPRPFTDIEEW